MHGNNLADDFDDFSRSKTPRAERYSTQDAVVDAGLSIGPFMRTLLFLSLRVFFFQLY